jgi:hypothetical protein
MDDKVFGECLSVSACLGPFASSLTYILVRSGNIDNTMDDPNIKYGDVDARTTFFVCTSTCSILYTI